MIILKKWLNHSTGELHYSLLKHCISSNKLLRYPATSDRYMSLNEYLDMYKLTRYDVVQINVKSKSDLLT